MIKRVDFLEDFVKPYAPILKGVYEKANIWPESERKFLILAEEIEESEEAFDSFIRYVNNSVIFDEKLFQADKSQELQGHIISLMCELLQVIAVLNKYEVTDDE